MDYISDDIYNALSTVILCVLTTEQLVTDNIKPYISKKYIPKLKIYLNIVWLSNQCLIEDHALRSCSINHFVIQNLSLM